MHRMYMRDCVYDFPFDCQYGHDRDGDPRCACAYYHHECDRVDGRGFLNGHGRPDVRVYAHVDVHAHDYVHAHDRGYDRDVQMQEDQKR